MATTTTTNTLDFHEPIVKFAVMAQDLVLENLTKVTDLVGEQFPNVPTGPADEFVVKAAELTDGGFILAEDLLGKSRVFVSNLYKAATDMIVSLSDAEVVKAPVKSVKSAAKKAA